MHPREEQLNDYVDDALDARDSELVSSHLEQCAECARFVSQLRHLLAEAREMPLTEPPQAAWQGIQRRLADVTESRAPWYWGKPAWALATAAAVVMAFLAGRAIEQRQQLRDLRSAGSNAVVGPATTVSGRSASDEASARERVLLVAVGDHLERSQMVLVELVNARPQKDLDISAERQSADELLASNRLYRQTAVRLGQANIASVLDDLERVLVEVARGPSQLSVQELAEIQQRIEAQGILFKVKIIGSDMHRKQPVS
jgi:Putative zinc-finger